MTCKSLIATIVASAAILLTASCSKNDDPTPGGDSYLTVVTLDQNNVSGVVMSFCPANDDPDVVLTADTQLDSRLFAVGSRIYVQYAPLSGDPLKSGPVNLIGVSTVEGAGAKPTPAPTSVVTEYATDAVTVTNLMRAGRYINMSFIAATLNQPKVCMLYVDEATLGQAIPELYFVFEGDGGFNAQNYTFIGSWNIGDIWSRPEVEGIRIFYGNGSTDFKLIAKDPALNTNNGSNAPAE